MPTTSFPTSASDVGGLFVLGMARALAQRGHRVEVLAPEPASGTPWTEPAPGVRVRWIRYARPQSLQRAFHGAGAPDNLARDPAAWLGAGTYPVALAAALGDLLRTTHVDAIASHWGVPCGLVSGAMRGRTRHVAIFHSADVHLLARLPRVLGVSLARAIAGRSDALVFASAALRAKFLRLAPAHASRADVIAMGIDAPEGERRAPDAHRFVALALARLVPVKGLDVAIRALDDAPGVELVIAGDGPERARLEPLARGRAVRFVGTVTGSTKARWLAAADALVLPSIVLPSGRTEGAPTAVLEGLAAGLPVVASDVGGVAELIAHERTGLLVPPGDPRALASVLVRLRDDVDLRAALSVAGRAAAVDRAWPAVAARFEALLAPQGSMRRAPAGGRNVKVEGSSRGFST